MAFEFFLESKLFWAAVPIIGLYLYLKFVVFKYFENKKVPHDKPVVPFGNLLPALMGKMPLGLFVKQNYDKFKKNRFHGIYMLHKPYLMINDPELIRLILIKEFSKFPDRGLYNNDEIDPLVGNLFFMAGEKWRHLRGKLSPTFTSGKLKQMFALFAEIGDELTKTCAKHIVKDDIIEMKGFLARYTTDSITSLAFGFNSDSLKDPNSEMRKYGDMVININPFKNALVLFAPKILEFFNISFTPKPVEKFFTKTFSDMVKHRFKEGVKRNDFLSLLMQVIDHSEIEGENTTKSVANGISKESEGRNLKLVEACAQAYVFFIAGFETSSSTATYCLYELALNPDIQDKLREEIDEVANSETGVTYDSINQMEYLHMVFSETLRKHPSVPFLNRVCIEDFVIPGSDYKISKGMSVMISASGLQRDPRYYPDPDKFDPTRFTKENISARSPSVYLPFGDGPRICIGNRFGILQVKIALFNMLRYFTFHVCEKTPIPVQYSKRTFVQSPSGGVYLRIEKRKF